MTVKELIAELSKHPASAEVNLEHPDATISCPAVRVACVYNKAIMDYRVYIESEK